MVQEHDASLALVTVTPEPTLVIKRDADSEILQPNSKKPRVKHSLKKRMGSKTLRKYKVKNKKPEPPVLMAMADPDEDPENRILWAQEPKFKHSTNDTTGHDLTMADAAEPPIIPEIPRAMLYHPWLVIADSEEESGDEVLE